jgi:diaminopimelate decarboxylase
VSAQDAGRGRVADHVAALPADALPAYVYDLPALRGHAAAVRAALPAGVELHYAVKANPEPALLTALRPFVDGYEVSSGGEWAHVRAVLPTAPLAFGGPGTTPAEVARVAAAGVHRWHVESVQELYRLAATGRPADVLLRANPALAAGRPVTAVLAMGGGPSPFGMDPDGVAECLRLLQRPGFGRLRLRGIHAHLASGLDAEDQLATAGAIVARAAALGVPEANIGGGMAVDYADPAARFDWAAFGTGLEKLLGRHPGLRLRIEPGRSLTAYCGWYATEVLDVKRSHGEDFAVVRGGTHHLRTPATRGHAQPFSVLPVDGWAHPWPRPAVAGTSVTLSGQLCTPKDVLAGRVPAAGLRAGDRVLFAMAGAYAWNISHHAFLMHPQPGFHVLDDPAA